MGVWNVVKVGILAVGLAGVASGCVHAPAARPVRVEQWVDPRDLMNAFEPPLRLESRFVREGEVQSLLAEYAFARRHPDEHYVVVVSVAPAGHFLDAARYEARRAASDLSEQQARAEFPEIGLRAQREFFGFGPGGAAYGLTFTPRDGRCDVRILVSNLLPEEVPTPELDLEALARRLEARYEAAGMPPPGGSW